MTKTQTPTVQFSHMPPNSEVAENVTALHIQPGMTVEFYANGRAVSGTVSASSAETNGPVLTVGGIDATPMRILAKIGCVDYAFECGHAFHVIAGRELANDVFRTALTREDWAPGPRA